MVVFGLHIGAIATVSAQTGNESELTNFSLSGLSNHRFVAPETIVSSQFLKDSTLVHVFHESANSWELSERFIYEHDNAGRQVESRRSLLAGGEWKLKSRCTQAYGNGSNPAYEKHQLWLQNEERWQDSLQRNFSFDGRDRIEEESNHIFQNGQWKPQILTTYSYNLESLLISELTAYWDQSYSHWFNHRIVNFEYDAQNVLTREVSQLWDQLTLEWVNESSRAYIYNDDDMLVSSERRNWDKSLLTWVLVSVISLEYNDDGQIKNTEHTAFFSNAGPLSSQNNLTNYDEFGNVDELVQGFWNSSDGDWDFYQKQNHYWSMHTIGRNLDGGEGIHCTFNNPYSAGLPWYCSSLKENVTYNLRVFDLLGRAFFEDTFLGQHTFNISRQLPSGVYIVLIQGGFDYHTEKIVIR